MMTMNLKMVAAAAVVALGTAATTGAAYGANMIVAQAAPQTSPASNSGVTRPSITLTEAVRAAEQHTNGRAAKVELEREDGVHVYEVTTFSKDSRSKVFVDFGTGNVDRVDSRTFLTRAGDAVVSDDRRKNEARLKALTASSVTLSKAIEAAESDTGGKAVTAKMKARFGCVYFQVKLIVNGSKQRVEVDAATAKVVTIRKSEDRDDDDKDHRKDHDKDDDD
jgi:uncharacterized membrane protein YkoI